MRGCFFGDPVVSMLFRREKHNPHHLLPGH